jgi:hypothetical protein
MLRKRAEETEFFRKNSVYLCVHADRFLDLFALPFDMSPEVLSPNQFHGVMAVPSGVLDG